jgi:hypothetical protein
VVTLFAKQSISWRDRLCKIILAENRSNQSVVSVFLWRRPCHQIREQQFKVKLKNFPILLLFNSKSYVSLSNPSNPKFLPLHVIASLSFVRQSDNICSFLTVCLDLSCRQLLAIFDPRPQMQKASIQLKTKKEYPKTSFSASPRFLQSPHQLRRQSEVTKPAWASFPTCVVLV